MKVLGIIINVFVISTMPVLFLAIVVVSYFAGFFRGTDYGILQANDYYQKAFEESQAITDSGKDPVVLEIPAQSPPTRSNNLGLIRNVSWGGPDLWNAVNKRRQELGVNSLGQKDDLCTVASIRLNELLELGRLDGHEGFSTLPERRPDIKAIYERYGTIAEFLAAGGDTAQETVNMWENTLAHKKLLTGGEYVWGCIYAQNSFAVAITAF